MINYATEELTAMTACKYNGDISKLSGLFNSVVEKSSDDYPGYGEMASYIDPTFESVYWNAVSAVITQTATPEEAAKQLDDVMELVG